MYKLTYTNTKILVVFLIAVACVFRTDIFSIFNSSDVYAGNKVTICHATGSASNPYTENVVSENAIGGHFYNNGTPKSGHEQDLLFQGETTCPNPSPNPTPKVSPTPSASPEISPTPSTSACPVFVFPQTRVWEGDIDTVTLTNGGPVVYSWIGEIPTDNYRQFGSGTGSLNNGESFSVTYPPYGEWGPADQYGAHEVHVTVHIEGNCGYVGYNWDRWYHIAPSPTPSPSHWPSPSPSFWPSISPWPSFSPFPTPSSCLPSCISPTPSPIVSPSPATSPTPSTQPSGSPEPSECPEEECPEESPNPETSPSASPEASPEASATPSSSPDNSDGNGGSSTDTTDHNSSGSSPESTGTGGAEVKSAQTGEVLGATGFFADNLGWVLLVLGSLTSTISAFVSFKSLVFKLNK